MISLKKRDQGFTIVELLIVIVVIGILALLVITTYSGIQQKARNNQRTADLKAVQTQLEAYFSQNGHYPSLENMNSGEWLDDNLKSLDRQALVDPKNPTQSQTLVATPAANSYAYAVTESDGETSCEEDSTTCAAYTLTATYEGEVNGSTTFEVKNLD